MTTPTNAERYNKERKHQVEERRISIIDAAERIFLQQGLDQTTMLDIAQEAGISKMTLYRYFPDRHHLAFEVAVRMLDHIASIAGQNIAPETDKLHILRAMFLNMIREFDTLRDAYRYIGMFDQLYANAYPTKELAAWYKEQVFKAMAEMSHPALIDAQYAQAITLGNTIMSFLEKMAARGELMGAEQEVPLRQQLQQFEQIILHYVDSVMLRGNDV